MTKKNRNVFARQKEVVLEKKKLASLNKERRQIEKDIKNILSMFNLSPEILNRFPISSFDDFPSSDQGDQVKLLELRDKIRKEHKEKILRLDELIKEIKIAKINLVLAEIKCIEKELDK